MKPYQCRICKFSYSEEKWAKACEDFCRKHKSCNLTITSHSIQNSQKNKNTKENIKIKKQHAYIVAAIALIILAAAISAAITQTQKPEKTTEPEQKFAELSKAHTSLCSGPEFIAGKQENERLQGACCSKMDIHRYNEQVTGLKKYSKITQIPKDPYDIQVELANKLLNYQKTINLTPEQQKTYNHAAKLSHEGGPCCCKCWRWYAFEGLAKYLITEHNFNAEQIAEIWELEDGCGGKGHTHAN